MPTKSTKPRGTCPACGHLAALTKDGIVLDHCERATDGSVIMGQCAGVGQLAVGHEPAWYKEWRDRFESGDTEEDTQRLRLAGYEPAGPYPTSVSDPLRVRCIRCGAERELVLGDLALAGQAPPACSHPEGARHLTLEEKQDLRGIRRGFRDERYEAEAAHAGWEAAEPRPSRETTPWKLRCATCGELVLVRVSKGEHQVPCPHGLTADEEAARGWFVGAGWEPVEKPIRGGTTAKWLIRCVTCGYETRREGHKRVRPCTHPSRGDE